MKSKNKKALYVVGGLVAVAIVGAAIFSSSSGDLFKGSIRSLVQKQKAPILNEALKSVSPYTPYKGVCIVRDRYKTNPSRIFPQYYDPDSGLGYEKISVGANFYSNKEVDDSCTEEIFATLGATFCENNPEGSYLREDGLYWQEAGVERYSIGRLYFDWVNCFPHQVNIQVGAGSASGARSVAASDEVAVFDLATDNGYASIKQIGFNFVSDTGSIDPTFTFGIGNFMLKNDGIGLPGTVSILSIDSNHAEILYTLTDTFPMLKNTSRAITVTARTTDLLNEQAGVDDNLVVTLQSMDAGTASTNAPVDANELNY